MDEPLIAAIPLDHLDLPSAPLAVTSKSDLHASDWPASDDEDEHSSATPTQLPSVALTWLDDAWDRILADESPRLLPQATRPRTQPGWMKGQSRRIVRMVAADKVLVVACEDGSIILFSSDKPASPSSLAKDTRSSRAPLRRPDVGWRRASNRSLTSIATLQPSPNFTRPRKASATVSVSEVDASGAMPAAGHSAEEAATAALGPRTGSSREDLTQIEPSRSRPVSVSSPRPSPSPPAQSPGTSTVNLVSLTDELVPFARVRIAEQAVVVVAVSIVQHGEEGDACLVLTQTHLYYLSLQDGRIMDRLQMAASWQGVSDATPLDLAAPLPLPIALIAPLASEKALVAFDTGICLVTKLNTLQNSLGELRLPCRTPIAVEHLANSRLAVAEDRKLVICEDPSLALAANRDSLNILASQQLDFTPRQLASNGTTIAVASDSQLLLFSFENDVVTALSTLTIEPVRRIEWFTSTAFALLLNDSVSFVDSQAKPEQLKVALMTRHRHIEAIAPLGDRGLICACETTEGRRLLRCVDGKEETLHLSMPRVVDKDKVTQSLRLNDRLLLGYCSGRVALVQLLHRSSKQTSRHVAWAEEPLQGAISALHVFRLGSKAALRLAAGSAHGQIALFDESLALLASWSVFVSPVSSIVFLQDPRVGRLNARVAAVSSNCTTAFLAVDEPNASILTLVGARTPIDALCIKGDEVVTIYRSGLARVWDALSGELRRSINRDAAESLTSDNEAWWRHSIGNDEASRYRSSHFGGLADEIVSLDIARSLDALNTKSNRQDADPSATMSGAPDVSTARNTLDAAICDTLVHGIDREPEQHGEAWLDASSVYPPSKGVGFHTSVVTSCAPSTTFLRADSPTMFWSLSKSTTAHRLLLILCLLRGYLNDASMQAKANATIGFYSSRLADSAYQAPSLRRLASHWLHSTPDVQAAARSLIATTIARTDLAVLRETAAFAHSQLLRPPSDVYRADNDAALLVLGSVLICEYKAMDGQWLQDCAAAVADTLLSTQAMATRTFVALDLIAKGWAIWQPFVNASDVVHALIVLSMEQSSSPTPTEVRNAARLALLQVAAANTPLFIGAFAFDVLHNKMPEQRIATLRLVAFVVRKKPLLMLPALPRLVEATVRGLDPMSRSMRQAVQPTATFVLNELVKTYPSMAFHGPTQRLAVGTDDGAVVVYDVKTATRLYVLEAHKTPVTAVSIAPDGRRLVSTALDESLVAVWKIGSSILGMLTPAGPPRQGSGGSGKPYKVFDFVHAEGDDLQMAAASTLHLVDWQWPAERTARLRIRSTVLTFSTA